MPGRRFSILYAPLASVVTDRTFSINAGLLASTVTPGSTAPVASLTTPANALCACAVAGSARYTSAATNTIAIRLLVMPVPPQSRKVPAFRMLLAEATAQAGNFQRKLQLKTNVVRPDYGKLDPARVRVGAAAAVRLFDTAPAVDRTAR